MAHDRGLSGERRITSTTTAAGDFYPARFGYRRCQDARLDGMETFTAVKSVCEGRAGRRYYEATHHPEVGRGTWVCGPADSRLRVE